MNVLMDRFGILSNSGVTGHLLLTVVAYFVILMSAVRMKTVIVLEVIVHYTINVCVENSQ